MLKRFVWLFVVFPAGILLVTFALANRHPVRLNLDPFSANDPFLAVDAPFFLFLFGALLAGLLLGGCVTWFGQRRWRKAAREGVREVDTLRAKNRQLDKQLNVAAEQQIERAEAAE